MSTSKKQIVPEFKGATSKMYSLLKSGKSLTHTAVMKFKKDYSLSSAYQILFRLRRYGLKTKLFTIVATGDTKPTRSYKLVKGVAKGVSPTWPKALPVRTEKSESKSKSKPAAKKVAAKKSKQAVKKSVAKKKPAVKQHVHDDNAVLEA